jgi:hypothetical protein
MPLRYAAAAIAFTFAVMIASVSHAQEPWSVELLPGAAFPVDELDGADVSTGAGADVTIGYRVMPHVSLYGGWGWRRFTSDLPFAGPDVDVEETGYLFGARFEHPVGAEGSPEIVIRLGGTYNHLEVESEDGDMVSDSGHGLGFEVGAGLSFRLGDRWRMTPGMRFRSTDREFDEGGRVIPARLRYVTLEVGFLRRF